MRFTVRLCKNLSCISDCLSKSRRGHCVLLSCWRRRPTHWIMRKPMHLQWCIYANRTQKLGFFSDRLFDCLFYYSASFSSHFLFTPVMSQSFIARIFFSHGCSQHSLHRSCLSFVHLRIFLRTIRMIQHSRHGWCWWHTEFIGDPHCRSVAQAIIWVTIHDGGKHCCSCRICRHRNQDSTVCACSAVVRLSLCPNCNSINLSQTKCIPKHRVHVHYCFTLLQRWI
jgi:hypothetical protein